MPTKSSPIGVFDYGNVLRNVSQVQNRNALTRNQLDPNSLDNQLTQAQLNALNNPQAGGGDPTAPMRNYAQRQRMIEAGATPAEIAQFDNYVRAQQIRNIGGVETVIGAGGMANSPLSDLQTEGAADAYLSGMKQYGRQQAQAGVAPVAPGELNLPVQQAVSEASLAGEKTSAQEEAKVEVESKSPKELKKQSMREADAVNAMVLIDDMLAPRKDNKGIYATYAYGRPNIALPDVMKPQEWIDAEAKRNQLVSMMQLENVAKLKGTGPITEPEQKVLRQAMTVLENPLISPELIERELKRVRVMFARWEKEAKAMQGKGTSETYEQRRARILGQ